MDRLVINTRYGRLPLAGRLRPGAPRPSLLVVRGSGSAGDYKHWLIDRFAGANVLVGDVLASPEASSAAYDEVIDLLLPGQPVVALGVATGCPTALGLRASNVRLRLIEQPIGLSERERQELQRRPDVTLVEGQPDGDADLELTPGGREALQDLVHRALRVVVLANP